MTTRNAPYRHSDGTDCYTPNCTLGNTSTSIQSAIANKDVSAYLAARSQQEAKKATPTSSKPRTLRSLEYGTENYNLFITKAEELTEKVDAKEVQSVVEYTGWAYQQYYGYLEGKNEDGMVFGSQYDEATNAQLNRVLGAGVARMDSLISKAGTMKKPVEVFRGEKPPKGVSTVEHLAKNFPIGGKVNIKRYLSTTMDPKIASEITGDNNDESYVLVIRTKEGAALGEYTSEHGLREKEVLLPRDRTYKVDRIGRDIIQWGSTRKNHTTVYLTME